VDSGAIGKLTGMSVLSLTHRKEFLPMEDHRVHRLPGGGRWRDRPHSIYLSLVFLKKVKEISVSARKFLEYPWVLYDDYRIELMGKNLTSSIIISHVNNYTSSEVELFGKEASIKMDLQSMLLIKYKRENLTPMSVALSSLNTVWQMTKGILKNAFRVMINRPMLGPDIMIVKFVKSIINDQPVPVTPDEGRETIVVMGSIVKKFPQNHYLQS